MPHTACRLRRRSATSSPEPSPIAASVAHGSTAARAGLQVAAGCSPGAGIDANTSQVYPVSGVAMSGRGPGLGSVAFGGLNVNNDMLALTFSQDCSGTWTRVDPPTHPGPRAGAAMAWDQVSQQLILFGGIDAQGNVLNDTWAYGYTNGVWNWTKLTPATSPPPKDFAAMATDPVTGHPVLYGGQRHYFPGFPGDLRETWTWGGSTWTQQNPVTTPNYAYWNSVVMATNPAGPNVLLMQEEDDGMHTYLWENNNWLPFPASVMPPVYGESLATDYSTGQVVWVGGIHDPNTGTGDECATKFADAASGINNMPSDFGNGGAAELDMGGGAGVGMALGTMLGTASGFAVCEIIRNLGTAPNGDNTTEQFWTGVKWVAGPAFPTPSHVFTGNNPDGTVAIVESAPQPQVGLTWYQKQGLPRDTLTLSGLSLGRQFTCGIQSDTLATPPVSRPVCWGDNSYYQFGDTVNASSAGQWPTPVTPVGDLTTARSVVAGWYFACALLPPGIPRCWGDNQAGEHGDGTTAWANLPSFFSGFPANETAKQLAAGKLFACALMTQDGSVMCWGDNSVGELGNGTTRNSSVPVKVTGIQGATAITAGYDHACAILANKTISCWGGNAHGQLGNGTATNSSVPVPVLIISTATALAAGFQFTCALVGGGLVKCWGANDQGQLGNGTTTESGIPVAVPNLSGIVALTAGVAHVCASTQVWVALYPHCWGANGSGQVPGASGTGNVLSPVTANIVVTGIAAGGNTTCYAQGTAGAYCIGANERGQGGQASASTTDLRTWTKTAPYSP